MNDSFAIFNLGRIPWWQTQAVYTALALLARSAVVFCEPDRPFYCLGYHQNAAELLDQEYCETKQIPVIQRQLGGGLVYLHPGQFFYQVIMPRTSRFFTLNRAAFYRRFLVPVTLALQDLGIPAVYQPIADICLAGRKISGNGAGEIGPAVVISGNVLARFDAPGFLAGLRCHSPLWTQVIGEEVRRLVGPPDGLNLDYAQVVTAIGRRYAEVLGDLVPAAIDAELAAKLDEVGRSMQTWSRPAGQQTTGRRRIGSFKITEAVHVDYLSTCRSGLWWEVVGVRQHESYTRIVVGKGGYC